jgi:toxin HigB-1
MGFVIPSSVIRSFRDRDTEALLLGYPTRRFRSIARIAQRILAQVNAAHRLDDLRAFPGNHLEALGGDRRGQHSIRVNDQYRVCFVWQDGDAHQVEVVDYH